MLLSDRSFDDDDSVDGSRPSSAQAAFKVPKVPKKPGEAAGSARRPSATGAAKTGETRVFFKKSKFKNSPLIGHYEWIEPFEACCNTQNVTLLICVLIWLYVLFYV